MQTGIFYVRLKPDLDPNKARINWRDKMLFLGEILTMNRPYPVLAVEYTAGNEGPATLYHIPADNNEIDWLPAELFLFARD